MVVIFAAQMLLPTRYWDGFMMRPSDLEQAWLQVSAGEFSLDVLLPLGSAFTATLLHGGIDHILFNMVFLWLFAGLVAQALGYRWMFIIFIITGIAGNLTQAAMDWSSAIPVLGASGAVMGFEGVYLGLWLRFPLRDPAIWPLARAIEPTRLAIFALIGAAVDVAGVIGTEQGVAYGAHLGGLVSGFFIGSVLIRRVNPKELAHS